MRAKHTPGPWTTHETMRDCVTFVGRNGRENLFLENLDGYFACQNELDARLIAAAPDLLYALRLVMSAHGEQLTTAFEMAHEAIAKATGVSS